MIKDLLTNKTSKEKAKIKGREIAKVDFRGEHTKDGIKIEITEINAIETGVEIFARAWKGKDQLGFGKDGSVDIERFIIHNPPILIDDPSGKIVKESTNFEGVTHRRTLREDPAEAIRQVISHNVTLVGKENTNIVKDKVGNTTSTFFPEAGSGGGNTSVDGTTNTGINNTNFATARAAAGTSALNTNDPDQLFGRLTSDGGGSNWRTFVRAYIIFDASAIDAGDTIDSATFSTFGITIQDNLSNAQSVVLTAAAPAANNVIVAGDHVLPGGWGSTELATRKTLASLSTSVYADFTLNASGITHVTDEIDSHSGIVRFGGRISGDFDNSDPGNPGSQQNAAFDVSTADHTGTTQDPKLVVEHSAAAVATGNFFLVM